MHKEVSPERIPLQRTAARALVPFPASGCEKRGYWQEEKERFGTVDGRVPRGTTGPEVWVDGAQLEVAGLP